MSHNLLIYIIQIIIITYINSDIKFNIDTLNESYSLDHDSINNSSMSEKNNGELANQNLYLCEDKKDCISCSFQMYQFARCYWDCDHSQCKTEFFLNAFSSTIELSKIYKLCSSCDSTSNKKMNTYCNESILVEEKIDYDDKKLGLISENNDNEAITKKVDIDYSKMDFKGLLCRYTIFNKYGKSDSIFHLNITKFYRYINIFVELDYGLYMRHMNLKNQKNYEIDTVGVNSITIYVYTPENYDFKPFSIIYSFKILRQSAFVQIAIFMSATIGIIFSILLILIFIELKKKDMVKLGKKEYNLNVNTLIFNSIRYNPSYYEKYNKKCFFCSNNIIKGNFITELKCKKHIYHYNCLQRWVRENGIDKTNFYCPLCQNEEIQEFSRSIISKDDNDKLINSSKGIIMNNPLLKHNSDLSKISENSKENKNNINNIDNKDGNKKEINNKEKNENNFEDNNEIRYIKEEKNEDDKIEVLK